jgi:hypothetical protein
VMFHGRVRQAKAVGRRLLRPRRRGPRRRRRFCVSRMGPALGQPGAGDPARLRRDHPCPRRRAPPFGVRSGEERTVALGKFIDAEGRLIVLASLAGAAHHPAWLINLAKTKDRVWVEEGRDRAKVRPEILAGAERARAWKTDRRGGARLREVRAVHRPRDPPGPTDVRVGAPDRRRPHLHGRRRSLVQAGGRGGLLTRRHGRRSSCSSIRGAQVLAAIEAPDVVPERVRPAAICGWPHDATGLRAPAGPESDEERPDGSYRSRLRRPA